MADTTSFEPRSMDHGSVALLVHTETGHHVGSGVLIAVPTRRSGEERILVATAAHNLRGAAGPRAVRVLPRGRYRADPLRVLGFGVAPRDDHDVAWIEVDAVTVRRRGLHAISVERLTLPADPRAGGGPRLVAHGYPADRVPWRALGGTSFRLGSATIEGPWTPVDDHPTGMAMAWPEGPRDAIGLAAGSAALPEHPRGLSGCGLWTRLDGRDVPVALARSWHGGRRLLYCTPIRHWLDFVEF